MHFLSWPIAMQMQIVKFELISQFLTLKFNLGCLKLIFNMNFIPDGALLVMTHFLTSNSEVCILFSDVISNFCRPHTSRTSNIAFLMDWDQMVDLHFGWIHQNISIKNASFHYQVCPLSLKSGKLWLNSYIYRIRITSN